MDKSRAIPSEPFPRERVERLRERLRRASIHQRSQASVLTNDLRALFRWLDLAGCICRDGDGYRGDCPVHGLDAHQG